MAKHWNLRTRFFAGLDHGIIPLPCFLYQSSNDPEQIFQRWHDRRVDHRLGEGCLSLRYFSHVLERYKGTKLPLPEIARELGVDALVEGRINAFG